MAEAERSFKLPNEAATAALAARTAAALDGGLVIYLHGDLGAGKSSFARALLQALGVRGRIKSPTYSLVESYPLDGAMAWHLDLYRIADPGELEWLGIEAISDRSALLLVEWPEHGQSALPAPDLEIRLAYAGPGRAMHLQARSGRGEALLARMGGPLAG